MALTPCSVETDVISQLPDKPVTDGGLTSAQFKAKFDQVGLALKNFINQTLIPQITAQFEEKLTTGSLSGTVLINNTITTSKLYNGCVTAPKLDYQAVIAEKVAPGAIETEKLAAGAVTAEKLGSDVNYQSIGLAGNQVRPVFVVSTAPVSGAADGIYLIPEE